MFNRPKRKIKSGGHLAKEYKKMIDSKIMETTQSILKDFGNIYFISGETVELFRYEVKKSYCI